MSHTINQKSKQQKDELALKIRQTEVRNLTFARNGRRKSMATTQEAKKDISFLEGLLK